MAMRSPRGFAGALILLLGVALAGIFSIASGVGTENVIHLALGISFLLLAVAGFEFKLPEWINLAACAATGTLAIVFLLQGAGDIAQSSSLQHLAYNVLGQRVEKILGYGFLLWCVALLLLDSTGKTKVLGAVALLAVLCAEIYLFGVTYKTGEAPGFTKLLYLPLFVWLMFESVRPPARA